VGQVDNLQADWQSAFASEARSLAGLENVQRDGIAFGGGRIHQRGQRGSARTGPIGSVEEVQHTIGAGLSGRVEKSLAERRRRSPIFFHAQRGAHRLADDIDSAALIAEDVAPSTGARGLAGGIAAESDSPRADGMRGGRRATRIQECRRAAPSPGCRRAACKPVAQVRRAIDPGARAGRHNALRAAQAPAAHPGARRLSWGQVL